MTFWIKTPDGRVIKLRDKNWNAKIYAGGAACDEPNYILSKLKSKTPTSLVRSIRETYKKRSILDCKKSRVLEIELYESDRTRKLAQLLESILANPATFSLYNVDVLPEQQYFYEKDLFPLALVDVDVEDGDHIKSWKLLDDVRSTRYSLPQIKSLLLDVEISDPVPRFDSRLVSITLSALNEKQEQIAKFESRNESTILEKAIKEIEKHDPDLLVTRNGDSFVLPFLYGKARKYSIDLKLNRDQAYENYISNQTTGKTYFSYGRILYRPATQRLFGRLHLDEENTFVYDQCRLQGLFEVSRLCRMPMHTSMRASIGKCLSSLQFYYAAKQDTLIPWKPTIAEDFKSGYELFIEDRGGLVLEPLPGIHENVCELDFASLYPSIIARYNISAETLNCACCSQDESYTIEGLGLHICKRKNGIVAESLEPILSKRFAYKELRDSAKTKLERQIYNERAASLKWILVCSFGYLSYRNAKFGKIDSHIAVCGYARKILLEAMHIAELRGFRAIHGIVDSLWITREKARKEHYEEILSEIEKLTGFRLAIEGVYKWIVFLPSKTHPANRVANRYFGCFDNGEIKVRGIEYRRHDAPPYFKKCQEKILLKLARCNTVEELKECARTTGVEIFSEYAERLEHQDISPTELLIRRRLSKELEAYSSQRQLSVSAASKLARGGLKLHAGQSVSYIITKYKSVGSDRAMPEELSSSASEYSKYDSERYVELLADACATVLSPFGITKEMLLTRSESLVNSFRGYTLK